MGAETRLDRYRGCLLALAVGDALGAPLEGLGFQQIRSHYGVVRTYVDGWKAWRKKAHRWRFPGLYSDDTQQALVLAQVLLERGSIDPRRVADLYLELALPEHFFLGSHRGTGKSFRQVIQKLKQNTDPALAAEDSAGIGAAMRIAPIGLYYDDLDQLADAVVAASLITHRDFRSVAGAAAVACAVRRLLNGAERLPSFALRLAADVRRVEDRIAERHGEQLIGAIAHRHSMSTVIARVEGLTDLDRLAAFNALVDEANNHGAEPECRRATQGFPPACIPACLYLFLTTESLEEAIVEVVNQGGDTDSAGAILGAMAGAFYGESAIPARWLEGLQNRKGIDLRAQALACKSADGLNIPDLIETEQRLTQREQERREQLLQHPLPQDEGDLDPNRNRRH